LQAFAPLFRNSHLATLATVFLRPRLDTVRFPVRRELFSPEPGVRVLIQIQAPDGPPLADAVLVHGLEGSGEGSYMRSMAQLLLESGYAVHRFNLRTCGGTEAYCQTMYHAGLTSDLRAYIERLRSDEGRPIFLAGYSLGGNIVLKTAGEMSVRGAAVLAGVCAVSTPIDLETCAREIAKPRNWLYQWSFVRRMKSRLRRRLRLTPGLFRLDGLSGIRTVLELDDRFTAPLGGFANGHDYYQTQSAQGFLPAIRVPTLIVQAEDDPLIPFEAVDCPELRSNSCIQLLRTAHGGHMGFIARRKPHFWIDRVLLEWMEGQRLGTARDGATQQVRL
jgi:uncharacterized protein